MSLSTIPRTHLYEIVVRRARVFPTHVAIGGQEGLAWKTLDSQHLLELVDQLAVELGDQGITTGDRVVLWAPNHWRTPVYLFALWKLGAVVVPFDREMNPEAAERIVESLAPRSLIIGFDERPTWTSRATALPWWAPGTRAVGRTLPRDWAAPDQPLATISFTSGTTGDPKGCMITHANLASQVEAAFERLPLDSTCRLASILPLSHLFELTAGLLYPLAAGAAVHYIPSRRGPDIVRVLSEQRITHMLVVPQIMDAMGQAVETEMQRRMPAGLYRGLTFMAEHLPLPARRWLFWMVHRRLGGRLRLLASGGAALPADVQRLWERYGVRVVQGYGTSECAPVIACSAVDGSTPIGSVGKPLRGVDVRLAEDGELLVHGPNVMAGYWADPVRTAKVLDEDGWYRTGDLVTIDAHANLRLVGRARDLIVLPSGMKVWPEDVEAILRAHPAVKDAALVAVPAAGGGARLHAYLIPTPGGARADLRQVVAESNARLAQHQRLSTASWWVADDFPRTPMLKVRRHLLPRPLDAAAVRVESTQALDNPVAQVVAGIAHVPTVTDSQTLSELGLDSLGLVDLALALEEKTGHTVSDGDLRLAMSVREVRDLLESSTAVGRDPMAVADRSEAEQSAVAVPLWPFTYGRPLRSLGVLVDVLYAIGVSRTVILGAEHLRDLPTPVIFAGTHHGFADLPLVRYAVRKVAGRRRGWRLVTAIAAGGFNSGGPRLGAGLGLYPWYGIVGLGLYPLRQLAQRDASLRGLVRVASAGNDILIFPQGTHARPADERAGDPAIRFHPGIAHLARALDAAVVPFGVAGTERVMPPDPSAFGGRLIAGVPVSITRGPLAIAFGARLRRDPDEEPEAFAERLQTVCYSLTRDAEQALGQDQPVLVPAR
ncbi:MAG TPA: AMP-binding protein [Chloroflexota bacterium]